MRRARILEKECNIVTEKALKCRGTVSVRLEVLSFPEIKTRDPKKLQKNVERLKKAFKDEGCLRLPLPNHIPAQINNQSLQDAFQYSQCSSSVLTVGPRDKYPELEFPPGYRLECLDGLSRALAAAKVLPFADRRWTVDLYSAGLTEELRMVLIEEYSNEDRPHPGEIYRKLRLYHHQRDLRIDNWWFEKRCWARLSSHQRRNVKQLHRYNDITAACDALLDIVGLWGGWRTSTWHKILAMRVDECILCYLDHIKDFWYTCVRKQREAMQKVDEATIKQLENTAPGACRADAQDLYGKLKNGKIFGAFNNQDRETIWAEVYRLTKDCLVPSFSAFFEDLNWLAEPAACVKRLMQLSPRETIISALEDHFFSGVNQQDGKCVIQKPDHTFIYISGTKAHQVDLGIRQIFLMAMRQYLDMPAEPKRKNLLAKPRPKKADARVLCEFAIYAYWLGFESNEIDQLIELHTSVSVPQQQPMSWDPEDSDTPIRRCGIPTSYHHEQDKPHLFLENLYGRESEEFEEMTSFFVRRSAILAFFGKPNGGGLTGVVLHPQQETGQEMISTEFAQSGQQNLDQHKGEQHSGAHNSSQQSLQAENATTEVGSRTVTQSSQQMVVNKAKVLQQSARWDSLKKQRMQRKNSLQRSKQNKTVKVGARQQKLTKEHNTMSKQQEAPKEPESSSQTMQVNAELESSDIRMSIQNQSQTPDHNRENETMKEVPFTATEQNMHQSIKQTTDTAIVHSGDRPYNREPASAIEGHRDQASLEQYTTTQVLEQPSISGIVEALRQEVTEKGVDRQEATEEGVDQAEQEIGVALEGVKEMQTEENQLPREEVLQPHTAINPESLQEEDTWVEQAWADNQRRDEEYELLDATPPSAEEIEGLAEIAQQPAVALEPHDQSPWRDVTVSEFKELPPISTADQEHNLMPAKEISTAAEDIEQSTRVGIGEPVEQEAIPIVPQTHMGESAHQTTSPRHTQDGEGSITLGAEEFREKQEQSRRDGLPLHEQPHNKKRVRRESRELNTDSQSQEHKEKMRVAREQEEGTTEYKKPREETITQKEILRQQKIKTAKLGAEQNTIQDFTRLVKKDRAKRRKRMTQIDLSKVDNGPTPKVSAKSPITQSEIESREASIETLKADINAFCNEADTQQVPADQEFSLQVQDGKYLKLYGPWNIDRSNSEDFMRMLRKQTRKDTEGSWNVFAGSRMITPLTKFDDIVRAGNNTLVMTREKNIDTDLHPNLPASKKAQLRLNRKGGLKSGGPLLEYALAMTSWKPVIDKHNELTRKKDIDTGLHPNSAAGEKLQLESEKAQLESAMEYQSESEIAEKRDKDSELTREMEIDPDLYPNSAASEKEEDIEDIIE